MMYWPKKRHLEIPCAVFLYDLFDWFCFADSVKVMVSHKIKIILRNLLTMRMI